jgi:uncharacterized membrane protein YkgB
MGIYRTPYTKFKISNKLIDNNFYDYLRKSTKEEIVLEMKEFKNKEISEFQSDYKTERLCLLIGRIFLLVSFSSLIAIFNLDDFNEMVLGIGTMLMFPALFLLSFTYSYALTLRELKKALRDRKRNLIKAQFLAKSSNNYNDFVSKITLNN